MNKIHLTAVLLVALLVAPAMASIIDTLPCNEQSTQSQALEFDNACKLTVAKVDPTIVIG